MEYKGYSAKVEFADDADIFHDEVVNLRDVITVLSDWLDAVFAKESKP